MSPRARIARADLIAQQRGEDQPQCVWECVPGNGHPHCHLHRHDAG